MIYTPRSMQQKIFKLRAHNRQFAAQRISYFALSQFKIQFSSSASNGNGGGGKLKHSPPEPICIICDAGGIEKRHNNNFSDASSAGRVA